MIDGVGKDRVMTGIAALVIACGMSGCARVDVAQGDDATFGERVEALAEGAIKREAEEALRGLDALYGQAPADSTLPPRGAIDWMELQEGIDYAQRLVADAKRRAAAREQSQPQPVAFPNPAYTQAIIDQLELERVLLEGARDAVLNDGRNTSDQYPIKDVGFIPPNGEMTVELDMARFLVRLGNDSGFDAYSPVFHVRIVSPGMELPILDKEFSFEANPEGHPAGAERTYELRCCGAINDPYHNRALKDLPSDAEIEVLLTGMKDHKRRPVLEVVRYTGTDVIRLKEVTWCLEKMRGNEASFAPEVEEGTDLCVGSSAPRDAVRAG